MTKKTGAGSRYFFFRATNARKLIVERSFGSRPGVEKSVLQLLPSPGLKKIVQSRISYVPSQASGGFRAPESSAGTYASRPSQRNLPSSASSIQQFCGAPLPSEAGGMAQRPESLSPSTRGMGSHLASPRRRPPPSRS